MFPPDKDKALAETFRILKPGGILVATIWSSLPVMEFSNSILAGVLGENAPTPPMNPLSLAEEGLFETMLERAGFPRQQLQTQNSAYEFDLTDDQEFQFGLATMMFHDKLVELDKVKAARTVFETISKVSPWVEHRNGNMIIPKNTFKLVVATK
jgi:ubiquinone/menaquinone biosynthesis C-methylase UbiE